jgi:hypothetical protein
VTSDRQGKVKRDAWTAASAASPTNAPSSSHESPTAEHRTASRIGRQHDGNGRSSDSRARSRRTDFIYLDAASQAGPAASRGRSSASRVVRSQLPLRGSSGISCDRHIARRTGFPLRPTCWVGTVGGQKILRWLESVNGQRLFLSRPPDAYRQQPQMGSMSLSGRIQQVARGLLETLDSRADDA